MDGALWLGLKIVFVLVVVSLDFVVCDFDAFFIIGLLEGCDTGEDFRLLVFVALFYTTGRCGDGGGDEGFELIVADKVCECFANKFFVEPLALEIDEDVFPFLGIEFAVGLEGLLFFDFFVDFPIAHRNTELFGFIT